ncbi:hypothetical protein Tco_0653719 [Tanacetum coccineum]|uniref:Uncharacterized protein n=1 Tax=Tanacetum coccineum TaxID=301880 RepID=A0ABQ4X1D9_9ASTR
MIKRSKCENKGIVPTEMELALEYTQQGASHEVSDHLKMEMEMEIPSSSNVKLITECSDTTYTCYEVMKDLIKVSKLPQTLISYSSSQGGEMMVVVVVELVFSWCGGCSEEMEAEGGDEGGGDRGGVRVTMLSLWRLWGVAWDGNDGDVGCGVGSGGGGRRRRQICQERGREWGHFEKQYPSNKVQQMGGARGRAYVIGGGILYLVGDEMMVVVVMELMFSWCDCCGEEMEAEVGMGVAWDGSGGDVGCGGDRDGGGRRRRQICQKKGGKSLNSESIDGESVVRHKANGWGLHYILEKVVPVGTASGLNNSDHNVNTITNGDGMQRVRTFRETISPE